jgi:predicted amidohydrolase
MRSVTISCVSGIPIKSGEEEPISQVLGKVIDAWALSLDEVLSDKPDLIILPELSDRPDRRFLSLDRQKEFLAYRGDEVLKFLQQIAKANRANIVYPTYFLDENNKLRNSSLVINRDGELIGSYHKNHLVIEEHEKLGISYADEPVVLDLDFGRVGLAICFDLNFEELLQKYRKLRPELLVFSSEYHGGMMQNYWAYSLRAYFAGSIRPPALSGIVSPLGETLAHSTNYFNYVTEQINLDYFVIHLDGHWDKLRKMKDKYGPKVKIHDPGNLGSVLITSECHEVSAKDIIVEFEFEELDSYLDRVRRYRRSNMDS